QLPQGREEGRERVVRLPGDDRRDLRDRVGEPQRADRIAPGERMRRRAVLAALLAGPAAGVLFPPPASAHGIVARTDLPIPVWLFGWAAALVLIVSFAALAALWPNPRLQAEVPMRRLFRIPVSVDVLAGAVGIAAMGVTVYAGLVGVQDALGNLAPTVIYVVFWVGLVVASVLFGNVWRALSPWRALARAVSWVSNKASSGEPPAALEYPAWLGRWPATLGILFFAWVELTYVNKDDPSTVPRTGRCGPRVGRT